MWKPSWAKTEDGCSASRQVVPTSTENPVYTDVLSYCSFVFSGCTVPLDTMTNLHLPTLFCISTQRNNKGTWGLSISDAERIELQHALSTRYIMLSGCMCGAQLARR